MRNIQRIAAQTVVAVLSGRSLNHTLEAAWKRALEIDPDYELARVNLALLPETRRQGPPKSFKMVAPFEGHDLKKSITFLKG